MTDIGMYGWLMNEIWLMADVRMADARMADVCVYGWMACDYYLEI